jgi:hypothetical protein
MMDALVNIETGYSPEYFGKNKSVSIPALAAEKTFLPEQNGSIHIHHLNHVHPEAVDASPLDDAQDPAADELDAALETVKDAISRCQEEPGILASEAFREACKLIRADSPEDWVDLRVKLKRAKPSGVLLGDIDDATRPPKEAFEDETTVADELVALVQEQASLFHTTDGACFVTLNELPGKTYRLDSKLFSEWLGYAYFTATRTAVSDQALRAARNVLTGIATHEGEEREAFLRAARVGDRYYLDLGSDDWSVIEIQATGWRHLPRSPVTFWRSATARPLPLPVPGGELRLLWEYANIPTETRALVLAWMLETWRPETPFPILELVGSQGTAKSSTQAKIRQCLDPNAVDLRSAPKSVEDLFVSAGVNWLASFNNLSHLSPSTQDALCNLATGGGFAARTLFTNGDETLIEAKRPVILNGIVPTVTAQDLSDRVLHIELPEIATYRPESEIDEAFRRDAPGILGGLLDLFVSTLSYLPQVTLAKPPRMADFARLGEAMVLAFGAEPGDFMAIYTDNRKDSTARGLESSPVATAIRAMVERDTGDRTQDRVIYGGSTEPRNNTMASLLERLSEHRDKSEAWPRSARGLGDALRRQLPALAAIGIKITISKPGKHGVLVRIVAAGEHGEHGERGLDRNVPGKVFSDAAGANDDDQEQPY